MYIRGTDKIRGILDLSTIGTQLKIGQLFPVSETQLDDANVKLALLMGFIVKEGDGRKKEEIDKSAEDRVVRCLNKHNRAIALKELNREILPNAEFELMEKDIRSPHIKQAIDKGIIQILRISSTDIDFRETFVEMGNIWDEKQAESIKEKKKDAEEFLNSFETNEELKTPVKVINSDIVDTNIKVIDTENPEPIKPSEIKDPRRNNVIWNPTDAPIMKKIKNATTFDPKKDKNEVNFVDEEADKKRMESHPKLKSKEVNNMELDFIDGA